MRLLAPLALAMALSFAGARVSVAQDRIVELSPGDSVRLVYQRVFERGPALRVTAKRLDVGYTTNIPAANAGARLAQADRAAGHFGAEAQRLGLRRLSIGICDTEACVERRHPPSEWHLYELRRDGWRRVDPGDVR